MKKQIAVLLAILLTASLAGCSKPDVPVTFVDPALEAAVRIQLEKEDGLITTKDLERIHIIAIRDTSIRFDSNPPIRTSRLPDGQPMTRLDDLLYFPNLNSLILSETSLSDASVLAELSGLHHLILHNNDDITDISFLPDMPKLAKLAIHGGGVSDLSPLLEIDALTELDLRGPPGEWETLDFYGRLPNLRVLRTDIDTENMHVLFGLTSLAELDINMSRLQDISPLANLPNLLNLRVDNNQITDITPLAGLTELTLLDLSTNRIEDLSGLQGLTNMVRMDISGNKIDDLSPLRGMKELRHLHVSRNNISDVTPLKDLPELQNLVIADNRISDISVLSEMQQLRSLDLTGNPLSQADIDALKSALPRCDVLFR